MFLDSDVYIQAVFDFSFLEAAYVEIVYINISGKLLLFLCLFETSYLKRADGKACVIYCFIYKILNILVINF